MYNLKNDKTGDNVVLGNSCNSIHLVALSHLPADDRRCDAANMT